MFSSNAFAFQPKDIKLSFKENKFAESAGIKDYPPYVIRQILTPKGANLSNERLVYLGLNFLQFYSAKRYITPEIEESTILKGDNKDLLNQSLLSSAATALGISEAINDPVCF
jgi:dsRNA-specific ribonuclease